MPTNSVQELYASTAVTYRKGDDHAHESLEYFRGILAAMTATMRRPIDVLDLGCGTGRYFHCYRNAKRIVGMDLSMHMLAEAMVPYKKEAITAQTTLVCANVHDTPLPASSFDFIASIGLFGVHVQLTHILLNKMAMALRPGGKLCLYIKDAATPVLCTKKRGLVMSCLPHLPPTIKGWASERLGHYAITQDELTYILKDTPLTEAQILRSRDIDPERKIWRRMWFLVLATKL